MERQLDFGRWAGFRLGHGTLAAHALIFTVVYSPGPVRHAQDKPRVAPDVRENIFRGEDLVGLANTQRRVQACCCPRAPYDVPIFATPKVARDHHIEAARGWYSVPGELIGQRVAGARRLGVGGRSSAAGSWSRSVPGYARWSLDRLG